MFEGSFVDDKVEGYGELKENDGTVYEGYWKNNAKNGKGKILLLDG